MAMAAPTSLELKSYSTLGLETGLVPQRQLGGTGEQVPVIGLGTGPCGFGMPNDEAISLIHTCIDRGVTYLDTAPGYERAQEQIGQVLPSRREEVFLATKCFSATAQGALEIIERSLKTLGTDHVDLLYAHSLGSIDIDRALAKDGIFAGLAEAKRRGWTRFIGFTAHHNTWRAERVLREHDVDAIMVAMNYADRYTYGFDDRIAPLVEQLDVGLVGMKVFGGAHEMDYKTPRPSAMGTERDHSLAFRYALGLPGLATAVIGMYNEQELDQNIQWAREWTPLTPEEAGQLAREGRELAKEWGPHFGPVRPEDNE